MALDLIARANAAAALTRFAPLAKFTDLPGRSIDATISAIVTSGYAAKGPGSGLYVADALATAALAAAHPRACKADAAGRFFRLAPDMDGGLSVEAFKLTANNASDDAAAATAAGKYAVAIGERCIRFSPRTWTISTSSEYVGATFPGPQDWITLPPGISIVANGAAFRATTTNPVTSGGARGFDFRGVFLDSGTDGIVTAAHAAGTKVVTVTNAASFAAGDWVMFRLGDVPYDTPETYNHGFARVVSVNTSTNALTLDRAMPRAFTASELAAAVNNKHVRRVAPLVGVNFGDVLFDEEFTGGYTGSLHGVVVKQAQDCRFGTVGGRGLHQGAFIAQYAYGFHIDKIYNAGSVQTVGDTGQIARFAECRGTVGSVIARNCDSGFALEGASVLKIGYFEDDNYLTTNRKVILLNGSSHIEVERVLLLGLGGQNLIETLDTSVFTCRHLHIRTATMPNYAGQLGRHITESLTLEIAGAVPEVYRSPEGRWETVRIDLTNGMAANVPLCPPNHILCDLEMFASSGITGGLTYLNMRRTGGTKGAPLAPEILAGKWTHSDNAWGIGSSQWNASERDLPHHVYVETAAAGGAVPQLAGQFILLRAFVVPNRAASSGAVATDSAGRALQLPPGDFRHVLAGTSAYDAPSIPANGNASTSVTVTGAALGDFVERISLGISAAGLVITGYVSAVNTVTVVLYNPTAAAVDLASTTLSVEVRKKV